VCLRCEGCVCGVCVCVTGRPQAGRPKKRCQATYISSTAPSAGGSLNGPIFSLLVYKSEVWGGGDMAAWWSPVIYQRPESKNYFSVLKIKTAYLAGMFCLQKSIDFNCTCNALYEKLPEPLVFLAPQ
jgi:hypothetical protein